jgi:hypothetical protein
LLCLVVRDKTDVSALNKLVMEFPTDKDDEDDDLPLPTLPGESPAAGESTANPVDSSATVALPVPSSITESSLKVYMISILLRTGLLIHSA